MRYGSVCSGIEAASAAWHTLGWQPAWFAEIEAFPSAVLAHHYPDVPNIGDFTQIAGAIEAEAIEAPDVLVGGTPCQAFSVAGLRMSLADARGNLSLAFVELANAIDDLRRNRGEHPAIIVWENVPGVLNTSDNAFGCFVGGLAGCDTPISAPPGRGWTDAGVVLGPRRAVAWRILDAQYFGLAQRRRRVFVVASARDGFDPASVLFEFDGVRRDSAPSREAREGTAGSAVQGAVFRCGCGYRFDVSLGAYGCPNCEGESGPATSHAAATTMAHGQGGAEIAEDRAPTLTLTCNHEAPIAFLPETAHTLRAEGFDASEDGTGRGTPLVPVALQDVSGRDKAQNGRGWNADGVAYTVDAASTQGVAVPVAGVIPYDLFQVTAPVNRQNRDETSPCHTLARNNTAHAAVVQPATAFAQNQRDEVRTMEVAGALAAEPGMKQQTYVQAAMQVRRLTPRECERLQGFPDDYTLIPVRGKPAADGPRYKAIGNSMAVPVMRWIGERIARQVSP